jgi:ADP-ribosylation factor protein 1
MQVILSVFDQIMGPRFHLTSHPDLADMITHSVLDLMDLKRENGFFIFQDSTAEDIVLINYNFEIPSKVSRGGLDRLMITVVTDPIQNADIFKPHIVNFVEKIQSQPQIYLNFHDRVKSEEIVKKEMADLLQISFEELIQDCVEELQEVKLGAILVLGVSRVGKTSFLHAINRKVFNRSQRPTLGVHVTRIVLESYNIKAFDVGGQTKLRSIFSRVMELPRGIVFLVDINGDARMWEESIALFDKIYDHYSNFPKKDQKSSYQFPVPLLLMGNKIDLGTSKTKAELVKIFSLKDKDLNCHVGLCSALENKGVLKNFRWLVQEILENTLEQEED